LTIQRVYSEREEDIKIVVETLIKIALLVTEKDG